MVALILHAQRCVHGREKFENTIEFNIRNCNDRWEELRVSFGSLEWGVVKYPLTIIVLVRVIQD